MADERVLSQTESVCPHCFARIPALRIAAGEEILLRKNCPEHGLFQAVIWRGTPSYESWSRPKTPSNPQKPSTSVAKGCPWDCGLCPDHRQQTCCTLVDVTRRCDLKCRVCFADAGNDSTGDPDIRDIRNMYQSLLASGGPYNVQLSGGEPTIREDLVEIISLGRSMGFDFIQLNSNGLRLAREPDYVKKLKEAGLSCVFLQFDGLDDDIYSKLRGRPLFREKQRAIQHCREHELGVVLVPTLVPHVNIHEIGAIVEFAKDQLPGIRGVHFQPVSYFGRYSGLSRDQQRITIPEIINEIEKQTGQLIKSEHFRPSGAEHSHCSFHGNFVLMPEGELKPWAVHNPGGACCGGENAGAGAARAQKFQKQFWVSPGSSCCPPQKGLSLGGWDLFLDRIRTHSFCISGMAFQDAWTLDLERLKECHLHVLHPDGRLIPFCAYNLTDVRGRSIYRNASSANAFRERFVVNPPDTGVLPASPGADPRADDDHDPVSAGLMALPTRRGRK